jgi:hypothetical protein
MEAGVTVVHVGGSSLANDNGAQHHGGRVTHFDFAKRVWSMMAQGIYTADKS